MVAMSLTDPGVLGSLLGRLAGDDPGEIAVVSVAACQSPTDTWSLVYGSVLLGPPEMASSWLDWRVASRDQQVTPSIRLLSQRKIATSAFAEFAAADSDWLIARYPLPGEGSAIARAEKWVRALIGLGAPVQPPGASPRVVTAVLEPADALVMSCRWWPASMRPLVSATCRPVIGYRFPVGGSARSAPPPPGSWPVGASQIEQPMLNLLGVSVTSEGAPTPPALAIGRVRQSAWLSGLSLRQNLEVSITFDPARASLGDLEVDMEEYADDGLAQARRLRLADVALPSGSYDSVTVKLPVLGPGLRRQLRLYDRAGRLLDNADVTAFVSQLNVTMTARAGLESTTRRLSVGEPPITPTPVTRLAALDVAEAGYTRLLTEGLERRILDAPATALAALQEELRDARDDLLILDPYFGRKPADWAVLTHVGVPVRVLTMCVKPGKPASGAKAAQPPVLIPLPPPSDVQHLPGLQIRSWAETAPWHDRVYLWAGGGLTVGGSPNGLGQRLMRLDRISPVEADGWRTRFDAWWADPKAIIIR